MRIGDLEPVYAGHHQVEHDRVDSLLGERVERLAPVGGHLDLVSLETECPVKRVAHRGLVVDHQDLHVTSVTPESSDFLKEAESSWRIGGTEQWGIRDAFAKAAPAGSGRRSHPYFRPLGLNPPTGGPI
jgi:hypothetical protein